MVTSAGLALRALDTRLCCEKTDRILVTAGGRVHPGGTRFGPRSDAAYRGRPLVSRADER